MPNNPRRKALDAWYPTIIRYTGILLTIALVTASALGVPPTNLAAGYVAAAGMILYKTVHGAAQENSNA